VRLFWATEPESEDTYGKFSEEWEKFVLTMQDLSTLPLYIDDTGGISIAQIAARSRRLKREKKIGVIVIDYLQLVEPSRRAENRVQEITEVTKGLKALAKELNVPIIALSQLSRRRQSRRQAAGAFRPSQSGSIEQTRTCDIRIARNAPESRERPARRARQAGEMRRPSPRRSSG
jgi:replicative DNA helicase